MDGAASAARNSSTSEFSSKTVAGRSPFRDRSNDVVGASETISTDIGFKLPHDPNTLKAMDYKIGSCARPYMRAFHLAWTSFFVAFMAWFSFAPLLPQVKKDLNLSDNDIFISNICSISSTICARFIVGPLMDQFGPRKGQSLVLILAAIPTYFSGLVQNLAGLATVRFFIGIAGATFVGCQFWCSVMFVEEIAGTVNAIAGGWGNFGGGLTMVMMVGIYNMNLASLTCDEECAWRNAFYIPATMLVVSSILVYKLGDDSPRGEWQPSRDIAPHWSDVAANPQVWILVVMYAVCFGVELHVNNVVAFYYYTRFGVSLTTAGLVASLFGVTNLFARALGGIVSDYYYSRHGNLGRKVFLIVATVLEGLTLILFSRMESFGVSIAVMFIFSIFVQSAEGATFAIVPYADPLNTGSVCGFVGAGGNTGAVIWGLIFIFSDTMANGFMYIGIVVVAVGFVGVLINVQDTPLMRERSKCSIYSSQNQAASRV